MRATFALLCLILQSASRGDGQVNQFEGRTIVAIEYSSPAALDPADLAKAQTLKAGEPLRATDVAKAIDSLFGTGEFSDIVVDANPAPDGSGVIVKFTTTPQTFVGGVTVEGKIASPPNPAELVSNAQFTLGAEFHQEDVDRAVTSMTNLLTSNGFHEAKVKPRVENDPHGQQVFLTFEIQEHKRSNYGSPVVQGNTLLSEDAILRATGWRIPLIHWWRQETNSRTRKGVQGLLSKYQGQDRLKAKVQLKELEYEADKHKVIPHLDVDPGPKVEITAIETKVSKRVLKRYVPVFQEQALDNDLLVEGKRNLESYFQSQGYHDAEVDFRVDPLKDDVQKVEYVISRGERFKVVKVTVAGNRYFKENTIRERMFIQPAALNLRRGRYSEAFRRKDDANIMDLYRANGFRDVTVDIGADRNVRGHAGDVAVTVKVTEGPQWLVDTLVITGADKAGQSVLAPLVTSQAGQPFAEVNLATDRSAVLTWYFSNGYPSASFHAGIEPSGVPNHVNVTYTISEGDRQFVRDVLTSGIHTTRATVVNKVLTLKPGDPLSPVEETRIQQEFYNLGIFARVDTAIENPSGDTDHKFILYNFKEANRYTLNIGVGAQIARFGQPSSQSLGSPGGSTGFSPQVSLEVSRLNFLGLGHTVTLHAAYSSIDKLGSLTYQQPRFRDVNGRSLSYTILYDEERDVRTFASKREEGSVQMSQVFSKSLTGLFRFSYRRVSVSDVIIPVLLIPQLVQPLRIGILSTNLVQDRRDNPSNPHRGIYNTADIGMATKYFGSQRSFARVLLRNATYYKLTDNIVLARQTQFGVIRPFAAPAGITEQESVPLPERFFGGGGDSLRAFPFNQAGPRDTGAPLVPGGPTSLATGFPLGGNALFVNNIEVRFPLLGDNIQGVLFHDMGNVYSSLSNISFKFRQSSIQDFDYTVHAAGFGIRYRTPVGPIRLDLAYSINPPAYNGFSGTPVQILQCNPNAPSTSAACQSTRQNVGHFQFFFSIGQTF
jgi:outer membrane protein insertion porin family